MMEAKLIFYINNIFNHRFFYTFFWHLKSQHSQAYKIVIFIAKSFRPYHLSLICVGMWILLYYKSFFLTQNISFGNFNFHNRLEFDCSTCITAKLKTWISSNILLPLTSQGPLGPLSTLLIGIFFSLLYFKS